MHNESNEEIHGHVVLQMMQDSGLTFSRQSLIDKIEAEFGSDARFYICSGGGMSAEVLVDTLTAKGKFHGPADAFTFNPLTQCNH